MLCISTSLNVVSIAALSWASFKRLAIVIKEIVEGNGASFAFPSQSIYVEKK